MQQPNSNLEFFLNEFEGNLTSKQKHAILNGLELTNRLETYAEQAWGLRPDLKETKSNYMIWSPPGAGKTFTVGKVAERSGIEYVKYHGKASLNGFTMKLVKAVYMAPNAKVIPVWIDDCDSFFGDEASLDFMKNVLNEDAPVLSWDVNVGSQQSKAEKMGDTILVEALKHFSNGGVGIEAPLDQCRFIVTTNKKLATKQEIGKKKINMHEHAVRDRFNWRGFDIDKDEAWGWMSSVMLSNNVFADPDPQNHFELTPMQMYHLLNTFYTYWDNLTANSMRTVKEAGAMLYNNPKTFADEFKQNFL